MLRDKTFPQFLHLLMILVLDLQQSGGTPLLTCSLSFLEDRLKVAILRSESWRTSMTHLVT